MCDDGLLDPDQDNGCWKMRDDRHASFKNCLQRCVKKGAKHTELFEDFQLNVVEGNHPLFDIIPDVCNDGPIIIVSQDVIQPPSDQKVTKEECSFYSDTLPDANESVHNSTHESLIGSPLKLQEFHHPSPSESRVPREFLNSSLQDGATTTVRKFNYFPIATDTARQILNMYNLISRDLLEAGEERWIFPIWIMCDAGTAEGIAWISSHLKYSSDTGMATIEIYTISAQEGVSRKKLPEVSTILREHCWTANSHKVDNIACLAEYDMFSRQLSNKMSELRIRLSWKELQALLQPPPASATTIVDVKISPSFSSAETKDIFAELNTLKGIMQGIQGSTISWPVEDSEKPLLQRIAEFLEELKLGDVIDQKREESDADDEDALLSTRYDMDFTERLWNLLKGCTSYQNLNECFELVLGSLQRGEIQPMVHQSNSCKLARMVRDSYYNKMVVDKLVGIESLELLAEIGAEKLIRDYMTALIGKDLVAEGNLDYYSRTEKIGQRVERIEKLHHVLELVSILKQFVHLPKVNISYAARHALKYYESHNVDVDHTFSIPVPANTVNECTAEATPSKWQAILSSKVDGHLIHSVQLLTTSPLFDHIPLHTLDTSKENEKEEYYSLVTVEQTIDEI